MEEPQMIFMGHSPHHKADSSLREILLDIAKTLIEKVVVSKVCMWKVADASKVHYYRKLELIRNMHGHVQRMVVDPALCSLHPVDDGLSVFRRDSIAPHLHSRIFPKLRQSCTDIALVVQGATPSASTMRRRTLIRVSNKLLSLLTSGKIFLFTEFGYNDAMQYFRGALLVEVLDYAPRDRTVPVSIQRSAKGAGSSSTA